jgi:hypothetical protein
MNCVRQASPAVPVGRCTPGAVILTSLNAAHALLNMDKMEWTYTPLSPLPPSMFKLAWRLTYRLVRCRCTELLTRASCKCWYCGRFLLAMLVIRSVSPLLQTRTGRLRDYFWAQVNPTKMSGYWNLKCCWNWSGRREEEWKRKQKIVGVGGENCITFQVPRQCPLVLLVLEHLRGGKCRKWIKVKY